MAVSGHKTIFYNESIKRTVQQSGSQLVEKDIDLVQVEQKARRNCFVQNVPPERFGG